MKLSVLLFIIILSCSFSFAFTKRVTSDGSQTSNNSGGNYTNFQNNDYDHSQPGQSNFATESKSGMMRSLAISAANGAGILSMKGPLCYRAVKQIIADGLGKNLTCIRRIMREGSAVNAGSDLERLGFIKDSGSCNTKGAVRVYRGIYNLNSPNCRGRQGARRASAGDCHGHTEVVGEDGRYHSFYGKNIPADKANRRRTLIGCYVPDDARVKSGPASKCSDAKKRGHYKNYGSDLKGSNVKGNK